MNLALLPVLLAGTTLGVADRLWGGGDSATVGSVTTVGHKDRNNRNVGAALAAKQH